MKRIVVATLLTILTLAMLGCGDGSSPPPTIVTQIFSDPAFDGDISKDPVTGLFTVTQGMSPSVQSVFAGVNPATGVEYRAFLDFPLTGSGGVPGNAIIVSATLEIFITSKTSGTIPILIDLVSFQPPTLVGTDYDRAILLPLASVTISPPITSTDLGTIVAVDVTQLMKEAQRLGLANFQVRLLEDLNAVSLGRIEISDPTGANSGAQAPLLTVAYF
jgi:hypothetical protein